ncbi:MAG: flagellar export chaperone FliS [Planctomycetaceae bacterium]|jgi:flagellar protein FliS|nr:flagellar export chaperone FliS [Planctomycetaceae bacterium]
MQQKNARKTYLEQEVFTATPQKLQLMLVEAAIKNLQLTKKLWLEERLEDAIEPHSKAQSIIAEILCSLDTKGAPEIAGALASIYVFIFRRVAEAGFDRNPQYLDDAVRVLMSERETWKEVCEKFGSKTDPPETSSVAFESKSGSEKPKGPVSAPPKHFSKPQTQDTVPTGRSWDA